MKDRLYFMLIAGLSLFSTRSATDGHSPNVAFGFLVIPLLPGGCPNLLDAAINTLESIVDVKVRDIAIGVDMGQFIPVCRHRAWRSVSGWHMWR